MLRAIAAGVSCLLLGLCAGRRLLRRAHRLQEWQQAMENMRTYAVCRRLPPEEMIRLSMAHFSNDAPYETDPLLEKREKELIAACLHAVLHATQEEQKRQLDFALEQFAHFVCTAEEKSGKDARLYAMLGVWGGLCIFLMCV